MGDASRQRGVAVGTVVVRHTTISQIPSEAEVLLPAGVKFKATSVLKQDASGLTIVTLEDDADPPQMVV